MIPDDTDVLITHTPPLGFGDLCSSGIRVGCVELLHSVQQRIKPKYHVYGHIHEGEFSCPYSEGVQKTKKQHLFIYSKCCNII